MNITLTQKERLLLEDQKSHEELCIKKYTDYANRAQDPQLKQMFEKHAQHEQQHLNTINQILNGQVPAMNNQQGQSSQQSGQQGGQQSGMQNQQQSGQQMQNIKQIQNASTSGNSNQKDKEFCEDLLMTEKYVSGTYDTTIFECIDTNVRQALNHIQKEEQQHGEDIFNYMQSHGMYTPQ
ncbi:spore coat protein [Alkaliphilus sp. B6464]|uniref:spore coat protein n=1 Tax=Alkaliphilus sp. B6464 TaxID=2731219 RepID=UPI001BAB3382|nr:spore coat protein [Alkaliphilus sp. B6464]QUH19046.1 spore coat protein [Alkaliphilus sp. B6464]